MLKALDFSDSARGQHDARAGRGGDAIGRRGVAQVGNVERYLKDMMELRKLQIRREISGIWTALQVRRARMALQDQAIMEARATFLNCQLLALE